MFSKKISSVLLAIILSASTATSVHAISKRSILAASVVGTSLAHSTYALSKKMPRKVNIAAGTAISLPLLLGGGHLLYNGLTKRGPGTAMGSGLLVAGFGGILTASGLIIAALTLHYRNKAQPLNKSKN